MACLHGQKLSLARAGVLPCTPPPPPPPELIFTERLYEEKLARCHHKSILNEKQRE